MAILLCALGALSESLFHTALAPLLDALDGAEGFSHVQGGLLVAGYAVGYWGASLPAYLIICRIGPRATAALGVACVAIATLLFAHADRYALLMAARLPVGAGSVIAYTGVLTAAGAMEGDDRRGAAIGSVYSGSAVGSAVGPLVGLLVGALVFWLGRGPVFSAVAVGQALVAVLLSRLPLSEGEVRTLPGAVVRQVRLGLWITSLPGFALGVFTVSGTYRLHEPGAGSLVVAIAFSGIAVINVLLSPRLGHASDRIGRRQPLTRALGVAALASALIAAAAFAVPTVMLIAIAGAVMLAMAGPGLALIGDGILADGGDPAVTTLLMNLCWGPAAALGAIAAGHVHSAVGAEMAFPGLAALAGGSILAVRRYA